MFRPIDRDAYALVTQILEHRYETLKAEHLTSTSERLEKGQRILYDKFCCLKRHWIAWNYPIKSGPRLDDSTPVPIVSTEYNPIPSNTEGEMNGTAGCAVWDAFVHTIQPRQNAHHHHHSLYRRRLPVFLRLSHGELISEDRSIPHIKSRINAKNTSEKPNDSYLRQSERCWKSLLIKNGGLQADEWNVVMENFTKKKKKIEITKAYRSKKG